MHASSKLNQNALELQITLSKISHEIRNPLALVSSELQLLSSHHPEVEAYDEWNDILDNIEYIRELLNQLSNYANSWRLDCVPTDMCQFLHTVLDVFSPTLNYLGISLETDISPSLPQLLIDRTKLRQALLNLLRNAQEAVPLSGGRITVRAHAAGGQIHISIRDNGCGITEEQMSALFTPFATFKEGGTGLGLAITRQIVEAHHGRIQLESTPHQGTAVHLFLG